MRKTLIALPTLLLLLILLLFVPITYTPPTTPSPSQSYAESLTRFAALQQHEAALALFADCESRLLEHGQVVARVMVLFHGYRTCPRQTAALAEIFYEQGYNVLLARAPHMGLADRLAPEQADLTADELAAYSTEALDIAQGLGEQVTVVGFSMGGVVTSWLAQSRTDVDLAVLIAPAFGLEIVPQPLTTPIVRLFSVLLNQFLWQNADLKTAVLNPPQVYPRNATRAISAFLRFGFAVRNAARQTAPQAGRILVITNGADHVVSEATTTAIVARWRAQGFNAMKTYQFPAERQLDHDLLDPDHPRAQIAIVYPLLVELIGEETPAMALTSSRLK
jgi:pimeloyl-ACP methyl ester carboxylesterase